MRSTTQNTNQSSGLNRQGVSGQGVTSSSTYSAVRGATSGATGTASFSASLLGGADLQLERDAFLKYATSGEGVLVSGTSDYGIIAALRDAIIKLKTDYFSRTGTVTIKGEERSELDKRFLLFEHELDGLLRRRIEYTAKDFEGGSRNLDFTGLLNEKENQIVELEKKIQNLEERLRRASAREIELENKIAQLNAENLSLRDRSLTGEKLNLAISLQTDNERLVKEIETLRANFASAASIWKNQVSVISRKYPNERFDLDSEINNLLQRVNVRTYNVNGI